ncbi:MAG: FHA domain-containing protein [Lachnospiraceae bacterium]|nr:FHA domain-containing protein [Lachnospiraceae bacterium]
MLVLTDLNNPVRTFEAPLRTSVVIGRSRSGGCQIILDYDRSVSHRHCQIQVANGQIRVMDLGSRNGTLVNGKRVIQEAVLNSGSVLTLGNLKMKVELR